MSSDKSAESDPTSAILTSEGLEALPIEASQHHTAPRNPSAHDSTPRVTDVTHGISIAKETSHAAKLDQVIDDSTPLPPGYRFLRRGDNTMTLRCRDRAQSAKRTVYTILDNNGKRVGIGVPSIDAVQFPTNLQIRRGRAGEREETPEQLFKEAVMTQFPQIPFEDLDAITITRPIRKKQKKGIFKKGLEKQAHQATRDYVYHNRINHHDLLTWAETAQEIDHVLESWGLVRSEAPCRTILRSEAATKRLPGTKR
ncbi:hypothetical protein F4777DRAFT_536052 [Nemania sp. FL0916]|nr:hypothetical protein F4777DRAFT_536052 [Nemania sp. FL0916]